MWLWNPEDHFAASVTRRVCKGFVSFEIVLSIKYSEIAAAVASALAVIAAVGHIVL